MMMAVTSVLTTVNAPYSDKLDAVALAHCLQDASAAMSKPGHMSSFFGEVSPEDQKEFAAAFDISAATLSNAAKKFASYSGETFCAAQPVAECRTRLALLGGEFGTGGRKRGRPRLGSRRF